MAKINNTRRMVAMALAAAVTVTAMPAEALAASDYSSKVGRMQEKNAARKAAMDQKMGKVVAAAEEVVAEEAPEEIVAETPLDVPEENVIPEVQPEEEPVVKDGPIDVTVTIPADGSVTEEFGNEVGTATGDVPEDSEDSEFNY
ncbi:MAG: hypothetical protein IJE27_05535, partial [Anaerotignum sp.]|nr:hypothetical protein [Anaerotignum sp.]